MFIRIVSICMIIIATVSPYTIRNPRIVVHPKKHLVQIKWDQDAHERIQRVAVFKLTNKAQTSPTCNDVNWKNFLLRQTGFKYCYDVFTK